MQTYIPGKLIKISIKKVVKILSQTINLYHFTFKIFHTVIGIGWDKIGKYMIITYTKFILYNELLPKNVCPETVYND